MWGIYPLMQGLGFTIHLWLGSIFLAGIVGLLVSFLLVPHLEASLEMSG
jgi:hypothetical protein